MRRLWGGRRWPTGGGGTQTIQLLAKSKPVPLGLTRHREAIPRRQRPVKAYVDSSLFCFPVSVRIFADVLWKRRAYWVRMSPVLLALCRRGSHRACEQQNRPTGLRPGDVPVARSGADTKPRRVPSGARQELSIRFHG